MTPANFAQQLADCANDTEAFLAERFDREGIPRRLADAMRHGALGGGKRLRPFLVRASAALFDVPAHKTIAAGAALEMVHCYSLIHDDLPDMDNDELRRGRPTVWKAYDPALAILAGDALLTEAFAVLIELDIPPHTQAALVSILAKGSGASGMVGGQVLDIEGEANPLDEAAILHMQAMKTGALIRTGVEMGGLLGNASPKDQANLVAFGIASGRAFQLADDILDVTATTQSLGKTAGKDIAQNKSTIIARRGLGAARQLLDQSVAAGLDALTSYSHKADPLRAVIRHFAERER